MRAVVADPDSAAARARAGRVLLQDVFTWDATAAEIEAACVALLDDQCGQSKAGDLAAG
jgi:hypothetical protein